MQKVESPEFAAEVAQLEAEAGQPLEAITDKAVVGLALTAIADSADRQV